ncbi:MAG: hypothetical protein PF638_12540 [Candidatus Delongbacteria bacterium]|jgi:hypothetical protein|nr:hypothetical protein [Candidatus Delongbacteria bacterium]
MKFSRNGYFSTASLTIMMIFGYYCHDHLAEENNTGSEIERNSTTNSDINTKLVVEEGSKIQKHTIPISSNEVKKRTGNDIHEKYMNTIYE